MPGSIILYIQQKNQSVFFHLVSFSDEVFFLIFVKLAETNSSKVSRKSFSKIVVSYQIKKEHH